MGIFQPAMLVYRSVTPTKLCVCFWPPQLPGTQKQVRNSRITGKPHVGDLVLKSGLIYVEVVVYPVFIQFTDIYILYISISGRTFPGISLQETIPIAVKFWKDCPILNYPEMGWCHMPQPKVLIVRYSSKQQKTPPIAYPPFFAPQIQSKNSKNRSTKGAQGYLVGI